DRKLKEAILIRRELTDRQWQRIEKLVPGKKGDKGRAGEDNRLFVDAVLWIMRTGAPWRDLPDAFGKWNSVYTRFLRWARKRRRPAASDGVVHQHDQTLPAHRYTLREAGLQLLLDALPRSRYDLAALNVNPT